MLFRLSTKAVPMSLMGMCFSLLRKSLNMANYLGRNWNIIELVNELLSTQGSVILLTLPCGRLVNLMLAHVCKLIMKFLYLISAKYYTVCKAWWAKLGKPLGSWKARLAHRMQCNECSVSDLQIWYSWGWYWFDFSTSWKWDRPELCCLWRKQSELLDA